MQEFQRLLSGVTRFDQLYGILNAWFDVLASSFSGAHFPANPTTGQFCYRTDMTPPRLFQYNGQAWGDPGANMPAVAAAAAELAAARGVAASLEARLDVALNDDGTLKIPLPAAGWWTPEADAVARMSDDQFSVRGDKRHIYQKRRAVRLEQDADASAYVTATAWQAAENVTVVSLSAPVVDTGLSGVAYGQEVGNEPRDSGLQPCTVEVTDTSGEKAVSLADLGFPAIEGDWFPVLQILGRKPYVATAHSVTSSGFTLRLYRPDGTQGADVSRGIADCGGGYECGAGMECGQAVPVEGVRVGVLIPA